MPRSRWRERDQIPGIAHSLLVERKAANFRLKL